MNEKKERSRTFLLVLYPEDQTHCLAVDKIRNEGFLYAMINHNQDLDDTGIVGSYKKPHWHIVIKFPNAIWKSALADRLGIQPNYIEKCNNFKDALLYLIHYGDTTKHQYSVSEVEGNLVPTLIKTINNHDMDLDSKTLILMQWIDIQKKVITPDELMRYCCYNGYMSLLYRGYRLWHDYLYQHNIKYQSDPNFKIGSQWNYQKFN